MGLGEPFSEAGSRPPARGPCTRGGPGGDWRIRGGWPAPALAGERAFAWTTPARRDRLPHRPRPGWRNGRRCGLKIRCPQGRGGSSPPPGILDGSDGHIHERGPQNSWGVLGGRRPREGGRSAPLRRGGLAGPPGQWVDGTHPMLRRPPAKGRGGVAFGRGGNHRARPPSEPRRGSSKRGDEDQETVPGTTSGRADREP